MNVIYGTLTLVTSSIGFLLLGITTINQLEKPRNFSERVQNMCLRWIAFIAFISIEPLASELMSLIPLGRLLILVMKLFVILPQNRVSTWIFTKIAHLGGKVLHRFSTVQQLTKSIALFLSGCLLTISQCLIDLAGIENEPVIKSHLEKYRSGRPSQIDKQQEEESGDQQTQVQKSSSEEPILKEIPDIEVEQLSLSANSREPLKTITLNFEVSSKKLKVTTPEKVMVYTLKEVRYIRDDLMKLELLMKNGQSLPIRLKEESHIQKWVKPVVLHLHK